MTAAVPTSEDEGQHPPGGIPHWSESWYFDAVSDDGTLAVYTRIGRVPGRGTALYTAAIVQRDGPTILVVDPDAPLPTDDQQSVATGAFTASQECVDPLRSFRIRLVGTGAAHDDHTAPLLGVPGSPIEVELALAWETDGTPYRWSLTDRYEVPCRVTGTVLIGDEVHAFAGPGQRDHSWGPRDWWGHEWMWSAFHLDDGTRVHAVAISGLDGLMIGYVQNGEEFIELTTGSSSPTQDTQGIVRADRLELTDAGLSLDVRPTGYGPLRLVSDDGGIAWFIRAMADVTTADGRRGTGWIEWNRVQPA